MEIVTFTPISNGKYSNYYVVIDRNNMSKLLNHNKTDGVLLFNTVKDARKYLEIFTCNGPNYEITKNIGVITPICAHTLVTFEKSVKNNSTKDTLMVIRDAIILLNSEYDAQIKQYDIHVEPDYAEIKIWESQFPIQLDLSKKIVYYDSEEDIKRTLGVAEFKAIYKFMELLEQELFRGVKL